GDLVEEGGVGEGAADVNSEAVAGHPGCPRTNERGRFPLECGGPRRTPKENRGWLTRPAGGRRPPNPARAGRGGRRARGAERASGIRCRQRKAARVAANSSVTVR